jgi:taurine dioxygenase
MSEASYLNARDPQSPLDIAPVAGRIGAEIRGIQLSDNLSDATIAAIRAALVRHKVIFLRDQKDLSDDAHEDFAARFGQVLPHPTLPVSPGSRNLLELDSRAGYAASQWHTDITFTDTPPTASFLRAVVIPEAGGDTMWANCETAYATLAEPLRAMVDQLWGSHTNSFDYAVAAGNSTSAGRTEMANAASVFASTVYETHHPVVRVHPESGERSLLLGMFCKTLLGLSSADSQRILRVLQDHITTPENTVRWRWREGDMAIWDNRATQHKAVADFGMQRRTIRRATIAGDVPVGIDGRRSQTVRPQPTEKIAAE